MFSNVYIFSYIFFVDLLIFINNNGQKSLVYTSPSHQSESLGTAGIGIGNEEQP